MRLPDVLRILLLLLLPLVLLLLLLMLSTPRVSMPKQLPSMTLTLMKLLQHFLFPLC